MGQALMTAVGIGFMGVIVTTFFGLTAADGDTITRHVSFGIFSTMITLLAHSMMMFYLIGKGKAVKDAMKEGGYEESGDEFRRFVGRISRARKPVFSVGTLAMAATMAAAILGASVDTGVLPPIVHGMIAYGALVCNFAAIRVELMALGEASRVVDEVNLLLGA